MAVQASLQLDQRSLASLKAQAASDPKLALREAARQFETLFMNQLLKSMRESTQASGMMDNAGSQMGTEMLDSQLAQKLAGQPGGLADVIARQLERQMGLSPGPIPRKPAAVASPLEAVGKAKPIAIPQQGAASFVQQHMAAAQSAEARTGIPASFMVSQAALETGWGRKQILNADGTPSNNLFGIKAGPGWTGATAEVTTTEYINGQAQKVTARFRAYDSPEASFADYAQLMANSPRYQSTVARVRESRDGAAWAQGLQQAGYATDPAYAHKLSQTINTTLRLQRTGG
ncbi:MAG: glucosaminidase domain-containing protein [Rubrivivax sp.]|jgi:flagellar protein FlgJ